VTYFLFLEYFLTTTVTPIQQMPLAIYNVFMDRCALHIRGKQLIRGACHLSKYAADA